MAGIPENGKVIYGFLRAEGFSLNAAAGIMGNIEQESGGNPNAGSNPPGKGLIQQLGDPGGTLKTELQRMMTYIRANGSVKDINAHASTPAEAALWFSGKYERPGIPDNANRVASANLVAEAARKNDWSTSSSLTSGGGGNAALGLSGGLSAGAEAVPGFGFLGQGITAITGVGETLGDVATAVAGISNDLSTMMHFVAALFRPQLWLRIGAFVIGVFALAAGAFFMGKAAGIHVPTPNIVPVPV
jgi:tail lysozyme